MAYGQKYLFRWESIHGVEFRIILLQDGYSGSVIQRPIGGAPVLKMQENECVRGTSLEWKAECRVDGEFADLYTSSPREFSVELYRNNTKIWTGFITPELYSEPDIAPPYDVSLVATDGLGELKLYDYAKIGQQSIRSILQTVLSYTGQDNEIYFVSQLHTSAVTDINFLRLIETNLDFEEGESCHDVLQSVLRTLHATITLARGKWFIIRETDYEVSGTSIRAIAAGTRALSSETTVTDAVYSIGQMGVADLWPVGYSSTKIIPAKKKVIIEAPWHPVNGMVNADFSQGSAGWILPESPYGEYTQYDSSIPAMLLGPTYTPITGLPFGEFHPTALVQEIDFAPLSEVMQLEVKASGYYGSSAQKAARFLEIRILFTDRNDNVYYLESGDGEGGGLMWVSTESQSRAVTATISSDTTDVANADTVSVQIPVFAYEISGTLRIEIYGHGVYVLGSSMTVQMVKGFRDTINIDNGARGDADSVEILVGKETPDIRGLIPFLDGILLYNDAIISSFSDGNFSNHDFLALTSRGYALSVALPRLSTQGHFNMPSSKTYAPLLLDHGGVKMAVQTYSWDLFEEEIDMEAVSLPAASLTVEDETVESMGEADIQQSGTSTSSGGGGGTGSVSSIAVNGSTYNPNSSGKVTLPNYPTVPSDIATQTWVSSQGYATESWVTGKHYVTVTALQEVAEDVQQNKEDIADLDDRVTAIEQGGGGGGSVVSWGSQGTTSNTIQLTVNGTTKTLVQKAGYDSLDDRVTTLENGGGGGSVGSIRVRNSSGTDGTYTPVNGVVTLPNYPTMLRSPNSLILSKTQNGTVIKEYNGEQGVTFTAADLEAALDGIFATLAMLEDYVDSDTLENILLGYVTTNSDVQTVQGFKKFIGGLGFQTGATANSGIRMKVVNSAINGVTKSRLHIYGDVVVHGEMASGDSSNNND